MSRTDDRIRTRLRHASVPVATGGVAERVARRRTRRRAARRAALASILIVTLTASGATVYGLSRAFGPRSLPAPGASGAPTVSTTASTPPEPMPAWICDLTDLDADVDGNGVADRVVVDTVEPCDADAPGAYELRVQLNGPDGAMGVLTQPLPGCRTPWLCHVFAAPDVDADGRAEVAVQTGFADPSLGLALSLYRVDDADGVRRLAVASPGDAWHPTFGIEAGADVFGWGFVDDGAVRWMSCDEDALGRLAIMTAIPTVGDASRFDIHGTIVELDGDAFVPAFTWDESGVDASRPQLLPTTFCGSPAGAEYEG